MHYKYNEMGDLYYDASGKIKVYTVMKTKCNGEPGCKKEPIRTQREKPSAIDYQMMNDIYDCNAGNTYQYKLCCIILYNIIFMEYVTITSQCSTLLKYLFYRISRLAHARNKCYTPKRSYGKFNFETIIGP